MTFLPADSEGGQNIYLWHFFGIFLGLPVGIVLAFGIGHGIFLGLVWDFFLHFFWCFFCQMPKKCQKNAEKMPNAKKCQKKC